MKVRSSSPRLHPRLRLMVGREIALGPGKADLLEQVQATGSLVQAARVLGMSYMRAWQLIRVMNRCFVEPLVLTERGGVKGGGAHLTTLGKNVLRLYRLGESASARATSLHAKKLIECLR